MPDDPEELRDQARQSRIDAEKLQGKVDALLRDALDKEALARMAEAAESGTPPSAKKRKPSLVIVRAPPFSEESLREARRSADVDGVEQKARTDGVAEARQQQRAQAGQGPGKKGDATRAAVEKAWREEERKLSPEGKPKPMRKRIENGVVKYHGIKLRTVQRYAPP